MVESMAPRRPAGNPLMPSEPSSAEAPHVALFVTCLVDLFRPSVGFAAIKLLKDAGCRVSVPKAQTCCGQPAYNNGARRDARRIATRVVKAFSGYDYVVAPSGSCAGMLREHYPNLLAGTRWADRARDLAARSYELTAFLADVIGRKTVIARYDKVCTYHDGCAGLRELGVHDQPRAMLRSVFGLELRELPDSEACCGFGGTFCVKYPEISNRMVEDKLANVRETGAELLLAGDMGCLMNMAGKLRRTGAHIEVRHVAEVLAGMTDGPGIGDTAMGTPTEPDIAPSGDTPGDATRD